MNADHYTEIGSTHLLCQDYALSGISKAGVAYAIVSDGCSSSPNSEVGAQVLCYCAKHYIELSGYNFDRIDSSMFGKLIINKASEIIKLYGVHKSALDATLLVAVMYGKITEVFSYGDGVIDIITNNSTVRTKRDLSYTQEAPFYLSYMLSEDRYKSYLEKFEGNEFVIGDIKYPATHHYHEIFENVLSVMVSSDGINSYFKETEKIHILNEFSEHKRTTGHFVKSNMLFHKRRMQKEGIQHHDDISVAVIDSREL